MAHFADLSAYCYGPSEGPMLNVGWLAHGQPFSRGPIPYLAAVELEDLMRSPVNLTCGTHVCDLCCKPTDMFARNRRYEEVWSLFRRGNGEVHVHARSGVMYAAPVLIKHYIAEH